MICSRGEGQVEGLPRRGGDLNFASEKGLGQAHFLGKSNIIAFNGDAFRGDGVGFDIKIARCAAIGACLSFARQPDFFPWGEPFGNGNLNRLSGSSLADGDGFFGAIDEFINGQRKFIFQIFAPNRGFPAASTAACALGKWVSSHAGESSPGTASSPAPAKAELL